MDLHLYLFFTLWSILLCPLYADSPNNLNREELFSIVADSKVEGELPGQLLAFQIAPLEIEIERHLELKNKRPTLQKVLFQTKVSDHDYLVLEFRNKNSEIIQSDVIRFDFETRMYHRWQIFADPKKKTRFLVGDPTLFETPQERRQSNRDLEKLILSIIWRTLPDWEGPPTIINEVWGNHPRLAIAYRSITTEYLGDQVLSRTFAQYKKNKLEVARPAATTGTHNGTSDPQPHSFLFPSDVPAPENKGSLSLSNLFTQPEMKNNQSPNYSSKPFNALPSSSNEAQNGRDLLQQLLQKEPPSINTNQVKTHTFEELNFEFTFDHPGWRQLTGKRLDPAMTIAFLNLSSNTGILVTGRNGNPLEANSEKLLELSLDRIRQNSKEPKTSELQSYTANELEWKSKYIQGEIAGKKTIYHIACLSHNNFTYQITYYGMGTPETIDNPPLKEVIEGFKLLDKNRESEGAIPDKEVYSDLPIGLSFDPNSVNARFWLEADLRASFPVASYGALLTLQSGIIVLPLDLGDLVISAPPLAAQLFPYFGLDFQVHGGDSKPITQGTATGHEYTCKTRSPEGDVHYRIRILKNEGVAIALGAFAVKGSDAQLKKMPSLLDAFKITKPIAEIERRKKSTRKKNDALIINDIGLNFLNQGNHSKSISCFRRAKLLAPGNVTVLSNLILALRNNQQTEESFELFKTKKSEFGGSLEYLALEPFLHLELGNKKAAAESFQRVFSKGHRAEDDLLSYINLLSQLSRAEEAKGVIDTFIEEHKDLSPRPYRWQHQVYAQCGLFDEALMMATVLAEKSPSNEQFQSDLTLALIDAGDSEKAIKRLDKQLVENPKDSYLLFQKGRAFTASKQFQKAKESYELALEQSPEDPTIKESLAEISLYLGQGDQSSINQKIQAVALPQLLLEEFKAHQPEITEDSFNTRTDLSATAYHFKKDEPFKTTEYRQIEILDQGGIEEYKTIRFNFDSSYERAFINYVKIFDTKGQLVHSGESVESYVSDTSAQEGAMATSSSTVTATVPGLKQGYKLHYAYSIETLTPVSEFPFQLHYFASLGQASPKAVVVVGDIKETSSSVTGSSIRKASGANYHSWFIAEAPSYYHESLLPAPSEYLPYIALGASKQSWETISQSFIAKLQDRLTPPDKISKLALEITNGLKSNEERVDAIMKHVRDNLVYQAIEFGDRARIPLKADSISKNRYGDCKDHSLLAHLMMKSLNIESHLSLVHTENPIIQDLPSLDQFNHMILYIPEIRGGTYYDGTGKSDSVKRISPLSLAKKKVLILDESPNSLDEISYDPNFIHRVTSKRTIKPDTSGSKLEIEENITFEGAMAASVRSYLKTVNRAEWKRSLEQLLGHQTGIQITSLEPENLDHPEKPLNLQMSYLVADTFKEKNGRLETLIPAVWEEFYFTISRSGKRRSPFEISTPMTFHSEITLLAGSSLKVEKSPWADIERKEEMAQQILKIGNTNTLVSSIQLHSGIYSADEYPNYSSFLRKAVDHLKGGSFVYAKKATPGSLE